MNTNGRTWTRWLPVAAVLALPVVLLYSSFRTFRELDEQKQVFLRERVAEIAGRLETMTLNPESLSQLYASEPHLRDVQLIAPGTEAGARPELAAIWSGRELYRTEAIRSDEGNLYRAYIPFHRPEGLRIARIDIDSEAAEFLLLHARHNVLISIVSGIVLILVASYAFWMNRRWAAMERAHLEWQHLAKLGQIAAGLAHEIRNPLGTIKGFAQLAAERLDSQSAELITPVISETLRLERLVNDLLLYGRPPAPQMGNVFWPDVAAELEQQASFTPAANRLQLHVDKPAIRFTSDPDLLRRILTNGLRNSLDAVFKETAPAIKVEIEIDRETLIITIRDNGPGIPKDSAGKLFQPFFSTKAFGTGLGLAISLQAARSLKGSLELRNQDMQGAEFILRLPNARPVVGAVAGITHAEHSGS